MKKMSFGKRCAGTFVIPGITLVIFLILCGIHGVTFIQTAGHVQLLVRSVATVTLTSYALSLNLNSGRFDFSIGSIALLSSVMSSLVTLRYNLGAPAMMILSIIFGLMLGLISGILYVSLKLPAIIVSLGVALAYEALAFILTDGKGISFSTYKNLLAFATNVPALLITIVAACLFMWIVFDHTKFGYNYKALKYGQKVAVDTGVREIGNAVGCYVIAGTLMGMEGYISATLSGSIQMSLNFGSIGAMFTAFLPMFIGGFVGRYSNEHFGMVLGALTSAFISLGFVRLSLSTEVQSLVSAFVLVLFLIYLNNEYQIVTFFTRRRAARQTARTRC